MTPLPAVAPPSPPGNQVPISEAKLTLTPTLSLPGSEGKTASSPQPETKVAPQDAPPIDRQSSLLTEHRARFNAWIRGANGRNYSIQLLRIPAHHAEAIEDFLRRAAISIDPATLYVYDGKAGDQRWTGVLYGEFELAAEAEQALASLPPTLRTNQPFVRPLRQLKP
jgi:septal ring-binding cell division protein DamX